MQVTITYTDSTSFTKEEVVRQAVHNYGKYARVEVAPESGNAHDLIYFGLQQIITHEQISIMFDQSADYHVELRKLRASSLKKLEEILDTVIIDNESKLSK
jgi:hypothetical protein